MWWKVARHESVGSCQFLDASMACKGKRGRAELVGDGAAAQAAVGGAFQPGGAAAEAAVGALMRPSRPRSPEGVMSGQWLDVWVEGRGGMFQETTFGSARIFMGVHLGFLVPRNWV